MYENIKQFLKADTFQSWCEEGEGEGVHWFLEVEDLTLHSQVTCYYGGDSLASGNWYYRNNSNLDMQYNFLYFSFQETVSAYYSTQTYGAGDTVGVKEFNCIR